MATKTIRILAGTSFTFPTDFGAPWSIELIGGGSVNGGAAAYGKLTDGNGTAYSPGDVKAYAVAAAAGDSYFDGVSFAAAKVGAKGATTITGGAASARPNSANTIGFNGGDGFLVFCCANFIGGGGAAGKNGPGGNAPSNVVGGQGDNGIGGPGATNTPLVAAQPGTEWSFTDTWNGTALTGVSGTIGSGGGGIALGNATYRAAGNYGAGAGTYSTSFLGTPGPGFILITYTVAAGGPVAPFTSRVTFMSIAALIAGVAQHIQTIFGNLMRSANAFLENVTARNGHHRQSREPRLLGG